jgi:outer membrane lipoprotein-sorting protein
MRIHSQLAVVLGLAGLTTSTLQQAAPSVARAEQESLKADQILERMETVYSTCKSYCDTGVVKTTFIKSDRNWTEERPFTTAFVRPDQFRYEFKCRKLFGNVSRYLIWRKGDDVRTWWDVRPGVESTSLDLAIAGATGVSGGSAHSIPRLLLPKEIDGRKATTIQNAKRIEDATLEGVECYRISGTVGDSPTTLWIDKQSFLLIQIEEQTRFEDFRTEETTTYKPVVNGEVPEDLLLFDPPSTAKR